MKEGHREYGQRSGLAPPGTENDSAIVSFYESPGSAVRFGFMTTIHPQPITFADMEANIRERVRWLVDNQESDKSTSVTTTKMFGRRPTVVVNGDVSNFPRAMRSYHVFIQEHPQISGSLWVIRFTNDTDEKWLDDFLQSVEIVLPATGVGEADSPKRQGANSAFDASSTLQCDICSKRLKRTEMKTVNGTVVGRATSAGFVPSGLKAIEPLVRANGLNSVSRPELWRAIVNQNALADWGLCQNCYSELIRY
jgi:hypothetical protein